MTFPLLVTSDGKKFGKSEVSLLLNREIQLIWIAIKSLLIKFINIYLIFQIKILKKCSMQ